MRRWMLLVAALAAGCAHFAGPGRAPPLVVSDDGRTVTAGGETWKAPDGAAFFQRGAVLHVVSSVPNRPWDVAVPLGADGKLAWPADAPFKAVNGSLFLTERRRAPAIEALVASGQLYPHDDHYHLTHLFKNEDWQALYRARADDSPLPPIRRQVAATLLAMLVDQRLPGATPDATEKALARMASIIGKVRRAVDADVAARAIELIASHDFEIRDDGRTLDAGGKLYRTSDGLRFAYCSTHVHVEAVDGKWAQPVEFEGQNGALAWPPSIFFTVSADGTVSERPGSTRLRKLIDSGQVRFTRDHWHVTEAYENPGLQFLLKTISNPRVPSAIQDRARGAALELMSLRLDVGTEAEFDARLRAIDEAIERGRAEIDKEVKAAAPRR